MLTFKLGFEAIGTVWEINGFLPDLITQKVISKKIQERIEKFDKAYSRFRKDSQIFEMSHKSGNYKLPEDAKKMWDLYLKLYELTDGKFTPLIGQTLEESGYDASYSLKETKLTKVPTWIEALDYNFPNLEIKKPVVLDLGGIGKGYLIDLIGELFEENKITDYCIDAGGDILVKSKNPIRVGLEHPENLKQVIGVIQIKEGSICASSGNRRKWGKFHHIINPESLNSVNNILATWAISKTAIIADSVATCLFLESPQKLEKEFDFEYLILYPDYTFSKSENFNAELFLA